MSPQDRRLIGQGTPPANERGWTLHTLHIHVRSRADATAKILIGVAKLCSLDAIPKTGVVSVTGAVWQDWKGTRDQPRAHRIPCNPCISGRNIPDFATRWPLLQKRLRDVLSETDSVTHHVNYADRLFETYGGIEATRRAVAAIVERQKAGSAVGQILIETIWRDIAWRGFLDSWKRVRHELMGRVNSENAIRYLQRVAGFRRGAPTDSIETVMDVAYEAERSTQLVQLPPILRQGGLPYFLAQLESDRK